MSNKIDERVVEMRFDNKQFEEGIRTSTNSINNLKQSLKLDEAARSLSNLDKVGRSFSLASISDGVDAIAKRFSTLGIIGVTAIANITNSAINAGKQLVSSLTIDPPKMGFKEYEAGLTAFQTILANTKAPVKDINKTLDELNTYANQTIYSFGDMTTAIGLFTAQGVNLKDSVTGIKGIFNLVSLTGGDAVKANSAIYQLSQAVASGTVKAQDWISVVNAGIGGTDFQNQLKQTARVHGIAVDQMIKKEGSFRDSLKDGWLTSQVLLETLSQYTGDLSDQQLKSLGYTAAQIKQIQQMGKTANDSATKLKTFTQLMDTLKSNVITGWATSFKTIIGDLDQASSLWTVVGNSMGNALQSLSDGRNKMLKEWADLGGRETLIKGIGDAFRGLGEILRPIHDAFRDVFPATTGKRLVELTKAFSDLTSRFKIGEETANNIKSTFKGLFAIFDIGRQVVSAIGRGLVEFVTYLAPAGNGILSFTGSIGDLIFTFDQFLKTSNVLNKAMDKLASFMKPIVDGVRNAIKSIIDAFKSFADADLTGLDTFSERVHARFEPLTKLGEFVRGALIKIANVVKKVAPIFYALASVIGRAFDKMRENIVNALDNADFSSVFDIINGGLFAGILYGLKKFIDSLTGITKSSGGFLSSITGILDGVKNSLQSFQSSLKANTLLKIAIAIGILSLALIGLSLIDSAKLTSAMTAMTGMFTELFASMGIFEKIMGSKGFRSMGRVTRALISLSIAILILSIAMTKLSKLDWNGIAKGLTGVAVLSAIMVSSGIMLSTGTKGLIRSSMGLILFATAINILASAVGKLGGLDVPQLTKGLIGVGVLVTELALFMKLTDLGGMGLFKGAGLLLLAASLDVLATAVKKLSNIDIESLIKGLSAIGVLLAEIALFVNLTGDAKKVISTSIGLTILGGAILILANAIAKMGSLSMEQIGKGLMSMGISLGLIITSLHLIPKDIIGKAMGLVVVATALTILSKVLSTMGGMTWEDISKGLLALAGSMAILAGAMVAMQSSISGAAAMLIMATALGVLTPSLVILGKMKFKEIVKGLVALAGVFVILGLAGLVLGPLTPVILALSAAVALFGVACLAVGAGMLAFSAGLAALSITGAAGAAALTLIVTSIIGLIPFALKTLAQGVIQFAKVIGDGAPVVAESFMKIMLTIINTINTMAPQVVQCVINLITQLLTTLANAMPQLMDSGMKIVLAILQGVANSIQQVVQKGIDIMVNFMKGIEAKLPDVIDEAFKVVISFINGLADAIRENHQALYDAVENLIKAMFDAVMDLGPMLMDIGIYIVKGICKGILNSGAAIGNALLDRVGSGVNAVEKFLGINSPSRLFAEIGGYTMAGFVVGINSMSGKVTEATEGIGRTAKEGMTSAIAGMYDLVSGDINLNPTISPVIDLTNVTAGANTINSLLNKTQGIDVSSTVGKISSINQRMNQSVGNGQNGSNVQTQEPQTPSTNPRPLALQLVLPNGKAIAEFMIDDLDGLIGSKNNISGRMVGV